MIVQEKEPLSPQRGFKVTAKWSSEKPSKQEGIVVDVEKVAAETKAYQPIPTIADFSQSSNVLSECSSSQNGESSDSLTETIEANYKRVKQEILALVDAEIEHIKNDPELAHLINIKKI